ncbi:MAG: hypothetical protein WAQ24_01700 [Candidatus Saccharimonadales bacterium]
MADQEIVAVEVVEIREGLTVKDTLGGFGITCTAAVSVLLPADVEQLRVNLYVLMTERLVTTWFPLAAFAPDQSPLAVHEVGLLVTDHIIVILDPGTTGPTGLLLIFIWGTPGGRVSTVSHPVAAALVPDAFLQISVKLYFLATDNFPVSVAPLAAFIPDQSPLAVHELGLLVASHRIVEESPAKIMFGVAAIFTTGTPRVAVEPLPLCPPDVALAFEVGAATSI